MTGANAVSDARDQRQDMLDHTRETVQVNRFEGFDKQNDFREVRRFDFSAVSVTATTSATGQSLSVMPAAIAGDAKRLACEIRASNTVEHLCLDVRVKPGHDGILSAIEERCHERVDPLRNAGLGQRRAD
jgi:hypothetical protein